MNRTITFLTFVIYCYFVKCEYLDLREGKKCVSKGINGTCVNVFKCPKAQHDIATTKEYPPICAFNADEPIICCTSCFPYTDSDLRNEVFNPHFGLLHQKYTVAGIKFNENLGKVDYPCKLHRKAYREFSLDESKNCYTHSDTTTGHYPEEVTYPRTPDLVHTVVLGYGKDLESAQWLCGGSIISEDYIVTAASCSSMPNLGPVKFVAMGVLNSTEPGKQLQRGRVKKIIPHPEYQPSSKYHDIALLETETPIIFSNQVTPIALENDDVFWTLAISWSELGPGKGLTETLESAAVTTLFERNELECSLLYPPQVGLVFGYNHTIQLCFEKQEGEDERNSYRTDVCEDDIGAPVQTPDPIMCGFALRGVATIGRNCEQAGGGSALYTRVEFYRPWIESIVWPTVKVSSDAKDAERLAAQEWGIAVH